MLVFESIFFIQITKNISYPLKLGLSVLDHHSIMDVMNSFSIRMTALRDSTMPFNAKTLTLSFRKLILSFSIDKDPLTTEKIALSKVAAPS